MPPKRPPAPAPRRRYEVRYDAARRLYVVDVIGESGERRQVEAYPEWEAADRMRSTCNARLEESGALLPERR